MNYRSIADLARIVRENLHRIPPDVDLVVGVPRSGILAASMVALGLNVKLTDLPGFLAGVPLPPDNIRTTRFPGFSMPHDAAHVLVVEDSTQTGATLARVRAQVAASGRTTKVTYCVVFASGRDAGGADITFEILPVPRAFEWNLLHRKLLAECCVDIDGVLCFDPTHEQNDDGEKYRAFLGSATACFRPSHPIGHLVTARLECYRSETEAWLQAHGFEFRELHMLDLPDAGTRRRAGSHASFKAMVYRRATDTSLFIESDPGQSAEIAHKAGKPVLCYSTQQIHKPGMSLATVNHHGQKFMMRLRRAAARGTRRV